jgi:hypothetical protein
MPMIDAVRLWFVKEDRGPEIIGPFTSEHEARNWAKRNPRYYGQVFGEAAEVLYWEPGPNVEP